VVQPPRDVRPLPRAAAPRARLLDSAAQLAGYDADGLGYKSFPPDLVVVPSDAGEMVQAIKVLRAAGIPICMQGRGRRYPVARWRHREGRSFTLRGSGRSARFRRTGSGARSRVGGNLRQLDEALQPSGLCYPPSLSALATIWGLSLRNTEMKRHGLMKKTLLFDSHFSLPRHMSSYLWPEKN
jgi:FAD/FMN-containing dehydrogenase